MKFQRCSVFYQLQETFVSEVNLTFKALHTNTGSLLLAFSIALPVFSFSTFSLAGDFLLDMKFFSFVGVFAIFSLLFALTCLRIPLLIVEVFSFFDKVSVLVVCLYSFVIGNSLLKGARWDDQDNQVLIFSVFAYFVSRKLLREGSVSAGKYLFLSILLLSAAIQSVIGLLQLYGLVPSLSSFFTITGTFKSPSSYSLFLAAVFPLSFSLGTDLIPISERKKWNVLMRWVAISTCGLILIILPVANIRSAWIGALTGVIAVLQYKYGILSKIKRIGNPIKKIFFFIAILLLSTALLFALYQIKPLSAAGRITIWKVAISKFKEYPISGVGYTNFKKEYNIWQADYFRRDTTRLKKNILFSDTNAEYLAGNVWFAYNEYLQTAVESGIIGLAIFLGLIITVITKSIRAINNKSSAIQIGSYGSFIAILSAAFFSYPFHSLPTLLLFFILIGILNTKVELQKNENNYSSGPGNYHIREFSLKVSFILLGLVMFWCAIHSLLLIRYYPEWETAKLKSMQGQEDESEQIYDGLYPHLKTNASFLIDYCSILNAKEKFANALPILKSLKSMTDDPRVYIFEGQALEGLGQPQEAATEYQTAHFMLPQHLLPNYLLAKLYLNGRDTVLAVQYAKKVLNTRQKVETVTSDQIIGEMEDLVKKYNYP